ncbi:MAG TPA: hypothetical protein VFO16_19865 [Pseudonocardiaceae bacterium]|nr:hypothetical protein [Pseudonocardiaceae bacterium]
MAHQEPEISGACAEPEPSQELREALILLRERSDNNEFRALVDDVLTGRRGLLDASGAAAFSDVVFSGIAREFAGLSDDDRQRLAGQATQHQPQGPAAETGDCGLPCATCTSLCALRGESGV